MTISVSGGRGDGTQWPPAGGELHVSDEEGADLCRARMAVPVAEAPPAETPEDTLQAAEEARAELAAPPRPAAKSRTARTVTAAGGVAVPVKGTRNG